MSPKSTLRPLTAVALTLAAVLTLAPAAAAGQTADGTPTTADTAEATEVQPEGSGSDNWHGAGIDPNG